MKVLSLNKSICESLHHIDICGKRSRCIYETKFDGVQEKVQKMGFRKLTVRLDLFGERAV